MTWFAYVWVHMYVCLPVYKVQPQPHNSRARLRPKLRKSSQHCHFSACFSFFSFFLWKFIKKQLWLCAGAQARARIWHVAKRNNNINSNKTLGMRRWQGGRGTGRGNAHSCRGVCQSVSQTQYAYQLPFSPRYSSIHSLIPKDANCCFYYAIFLSISGLQST